MKRTAIPQLLRKQVFEEKGFICSYCKVDLLLLPPRDRTADHVLHVYRGGKNTLENLVPCCRSCNSSRHTMEAEEFIEYLANRHDPKYIYLRQKTNAAYWREQKTLATQRRSEAAKKAWKTRRAKKLIVDNSLALNS